MTQETTIQPSTAPESTPETRMPEQKLIDKKQIPIQEIVESLKSAGEDIGQISELSNEEKLLVAQFFTSLLKLMQPLTPSIAVSNKVLPAELNEVTQAHVDPTGKLAMLFQDGHLELVDLSESKNRNLMMAVVGDVLPKFKSLTSQEKRKVENRIKFLSTLTKEIQKSADALHAVMTEPHK
jgi:hypothetical protein